MANPEELAALIREVIEDEPLSECAEDGISCPFCGRQWNQARAQFGDGVGIEHSDTCWISRASKAIS